mmetsp:Transcript_22625/g.52712  ORF Transcript_22625/g.52712 Transcript_22625/m.52712 type:complete len:649 (+) Transcript_22625:39-1985(+)
MDTTPSRRDSVAKGGAKPFVESWKQDVEKALNMNKLSQDFSKQAGLEVKKAAVDLAVKLEKFLTAHEIFLAKIQKKSSAFDVKLAAARAHDSKQKKPSNKAVKKVIEAYTKRLVKVEAGPMKELRDHFKELEDRKQLSRLYMNTWDLFDKHATDAFNCLLEQDELVAMKFVVDMSSYIGFREKLRHAGAEIPDTEPMCTPRPSDLRHKVKFVPMSQRPDQIAGGSGPAAAAEGMTPISEDEDEPSAPPETPGTPKNRSTTRTPPVSASASSHRVVELEAQVAAMRQLLQNPRIKNVVCAEAKDNEELHELVVKAQIADEADIALASPLQQSAEADWETFTPGAAAPAAGADFDDGGFVAAAALNDAGWDSDSDDKAAEWSRPAGLVSVAPTSADAKPSPASPAAPEFEATWAADPFPDADSFSPTASPPVGASGGGFADFDTAGGFHEIAALEPAGGGAAPKASPGHGPAMVDLDDFFAAPASPAKAVDKAPLSFDSPPPAAGPPAKALPATPPQKKLPALPPKANANAFGLVSMVADPPTASPVPAAAPAKTPSPPSSPLTPPSATPPLQAQLAPAATALDDSAMSADDADLVHAHAKHDFEGEAEGELSFKQGDRITYHRDSENDGWCFGELAGGASGWFPLSFTE